MGCRWGADLNPLQKTLGDPRVDVDEGVGGAGSAVRGVTLRQRTVGGEWDRPGQVLLGFIGRRAVLAGDVYLPDENAFRAAKLLNSIQYIK